MEHQVLAQTGFTHVIISQIDSTYDGIVHIIVDFDDCGGDDEVELGISGFVQITPISLITMILMKKRIE